MSPADDRRPERSARQQGQSPAQRPPRQRQGPLFPLEDEDIALEARRGPPAPLGDLFEDIDRALPTKAAPPRPAPRPAERDPAAAPQAARSAAPAPPSSQPAQLPATHTRPSARPSAQADAGRHAAAVTPAPQTSGPRGGASGQAADAWEAERRPVLTRERTRATQQELRPAPVAELVESETAPLRRARTRLDAADADLARLEHEAAVRGRLDYGGYLAPAAPALSMNHWVWVGLVAMASLLVLFTFGGDAGAALSRWGGLFDGGPSSESRATLFAGTARPAGDYTLRAPPSLTPEMIDRILAAYGSPAAGTGEIWYNLGLQYGIDPAFAIAFFIMESTAGTADGWAGLKPDGSTTHNVGNIICAGYASCFQGHRDYPSWEAGVEDWYRLIQNEYIEGRGHQTIGDVLPVYCPFSDGCRPDRYTQFVQETIDKWRNGILP